MASPAGAPAPSDPAPSGGAGMACSGVDSCLDGAREM